MLRLVISILSLSSLPEATAFVPIRITPTVAVSVVSSKKGDAGDDGMQHHQMFAAGSFVEFVEKKRTHIGKVDTVEHKSSGSSRYQVIDSEGKKFDIPEKDILYSFPCPNTPGKASELYDQFCEAHDTTSIRSIQQAIDVTPDLLVMAWEEVTDESDEGSSSNLLTPASFIELVHGHAATAIEKYMAWRLLQSEMSHVFFKEIRLHGKVVSFKAKTRKAVEAAKDVFCRTHQDDNEICFV